MHGDGIKLISDAANIKALSGTVSSGETYLDKQATELRVGDAKFPVQNTGRLAFEEDGVMRQEGGTLLIAYGNLWYTPNIITVKTV